MKSEQENVIMKVAEEIITHDLDSDEIEQNKHIFNDLTSIKVNFEAEELKISSGNIKSFKEEDKKIKDLFKNHVFLF